MFTLPPKRGTTRKHKLIKKGEWRSACASGLSTLCQVSDQAAADRRSRRHHWRSPTATGPRCLQCSRARASEFSLRSHLRSHISRPSQRYSSTNVIVDVDGPLQGKAMHHVGVCWAPKKWDALGSVTIFWSPTYANMAPCLALPCLALQ